MLSDKWLQRYRLPPPPPPPPAWTLLQGLTLTFQGQESGGLLTFEIKESQQKFRSPNLKPLFSKFIFCCFFVMLGGNQGDLKGPKLYLLKIILPGAPMPRQLSTLFQTISAWTIIVGHLPNFIFKKYIIWQVSHYNAPSGCCVNSPVYMFIKLSKHQSI